MGSSFSGKKRQGHLLRMKGTEGRNVRGLRVEKI